MTASAVLVRPQDAPPVAPDGPGDRIVDAALRCVARWGLAKTTLDDIAREAGCGRATLYRLFPGGRDALWAAVVATESARLSRRLARRVSEDGDLETAVVGLISETAGFLSGHAALRFLFDHEPGAILPHLAFHRAQGIFAAAGELGASLLAPWLGQADDEAARVGEWLARIVISYLCSPSATVDLTDEGSTRTFVRTFVLPGLCRAPAPV